MIVRIKGVNMFNLLASTQLYVWIGVIGIGALIAIIILLCYKYIPTFKHEKNVKSDLENATDEVNTMVRNNIDIIEEQSVWVDQKIKIIDDKAELNDVDLTEEDYMFLIFQEKMNELDLNFRKTHEIK